MDIDVEQEIAKYQQELDGFTKQLQLAQQQEATLRQAIAERRGIIIYLQSLNHVKPEGED